jgi:hypothetical protein
MGVSILAGAITTFGAGILCFLGTARPMTKIGVLVTATIAISLFVSMVLFGAIIHVMGP